MNVSHSSTAAECYRRKIFKNNNSSRILLLKGLLDLLRAVKEKLHLPLRCTGNTNISNSSTAAEKVLEERLPKNDLCKNFSLEEVNADTSRKLWKNYILLFDVQDNTNVSNSSTAAECSRRKT